MAGKIDTAFEECKKAIVEEIKKKASDDIPVAMDYMVDELKDETTKMFNSLIAQFYEYETRSYIRHWEGKPGTKKGSNMLYAFHCRKLHRNGYPYLMIHIDADDVAGGYQWGSVNQVVDFVMSGVRFPWEQGEQMQRMEWSGSYDGKYFSYRGTPYEIFDSFFEHFEDIAAPIFFKKFKALGW